MQVINAVFMIA